MTKKGEHHSKEHIQKLKDSWTPKRKKKFSKMKSGIGNNRYKDGKIMREIKNRLQNQKRLLKKFGKWECEVCRKKEGNNYGQTLIVHHKDKNRDNNKIENLMLVCQSCHVTIHNYQRWETWRKRNEFSD